MRQTGNQRRRRWSVEVFVDSISTPLTRSYHLVSHSHMRRCGGDAQRMNRLPAILADGRWFTAEGQKFTSIFRHNSVIKSLSTVTQIFYKFVWPLVCTQTVVGRYNQKFSGYFFFHVYIKSGRCQIIWYDHKLYIKTEGMRDPQK